MFSWGLNGLADGSAPADGGVMADEPGETACVTVDAKLKSVFAESGVHLLD